MGVGTPGFEFQLTANRLGTGLTFLESKEVQPAQQGLLWERDAAGCRRRLVSAKGFELGGEQVPRHRLGGGCRSPGRTPGFWPLEATPEE